MCFSIFLYLVHNQSESEGLEFASTRSVYHLLEYASFSCSGKVFLREKNMS